MVDDRKIMVVNVSRKLYICGLNLFWQEFCKNTRYFLKHKITYLVILVMACAGFGFQQGFDTNARVKAVYLYNFTRYFEWPEGMKDGNFVIQVVGTNNNLNQELAKLASTKQVGNQKLEIKSSIAVDKDAKPHILFLLPEASGVLPEVLTKLKGRNTLVITEKTGLAKAGASINFVIVDNKVKFEYNKASAAKAGLKSNDEIKNLAVAVY